MTPNLSHEGGGTWRTKAYKALGRLDVENIYFVPVRAGPAERTRRYLPAFTHPSFAIFELKTCVDKKVPGCIHVLLYQCVFLSLGHAPRRSLNTCPTTTSGRGISSDRRGLRRERGPAACPSPATVSGVPDESGGEGLVSIRMCLTARYIPH